MLLTTWKKGINLPCYPTITTYVCPVVLIGVQDSENYTRIKTDKVTQTLKGFMCFVLSLKKLICVNPFI